MENMTSKLLMQTSQGYDFSFKIRFIASWTT